jgi:hypothetical protein
VAFALPCPHQFGARLDAPRKFKPAVRFRDCGLDQLIEQPLRRLGETAVGLFLNPLCDAPPQQVRTECLGRVGPEQLPVPKAQRNDRHGRQPIQLGLYCWIGRLRRQVLSGSHHDAAPAFAIR